MNNRNTVLDKVRTNIIRHSMVKEGDKLVVGVSGGADSVCLLHVLNSLRDTFNYSLKVVHVNHMLRGIEANLDQQFVEEMSRGLGIECVVEKKEVQKYAHEKRLSLEEAGREIRYEAFRSAVATEAFICKIAVAHNVNDQIETILMNIIRGSGNEGLVGMAYVQNHIIRPLLDITRTEIEEYCKLNGLSYRTDSTNLETDYTRNKVRLELIPYIQSNLNKNINKSIIQLAEIIKEENDYIENVCASEYNKCTIKEELWKITLDINKLNPLHIAIKRKVLRRAIKNLRGNLKGIEYKHISSIIELCEKRKTGKVISLPKDLCAFIQYDYLIFGDISKGNNEKGKFEAKDKNKSKQKNDSSNEAIAIDIPGDLHVEKMQIIIKTRIIKTENMDSSEVKLKQKQTDYCQRLDYDKIGKELVVRYRQEGDRIFPKGATGSKKLKDFFIDNKVPREKRDKTPILACSNNVVWIPGYRTGEAYRVTDETDNILHIECILL